MTRETMLKTINDEMWSYNQAIAYGSECNAWGDFVADSFDQCGVAPWADETGTIETSPDFAQFWLAVAAGQSPDYAPDTGDRIT
jgi:hypothetical protein